MSDTANVAVIGCGIFGAEIAAKARRCGLSVVVYEASGDILSGASRNNQNRLHLGFHYPRDIETGRQSIRGFKAFRDKYEDCIESNFPNAYFIAANGSHTSVEAYLEFCERLGESYERIALGSFPIKVTNADPAVLCGETVYDCDILKKLVWGELRDTGVAVSLADKVLRIERSGDRIKVQSANRPPVLADVVINTSYANINLLTEQLGYAAPEWLFEYTVVPIIRLAVPKVGVTIMDGPFMTILPHGKSGNFLLYNVEKTVVEKNLSSQLDQKWLTRESAPFSGMNKARYFRETIDLCREYVPALAGAQLADFLEGPRAVLPRRDDTDARPSIITDYGGNYFTVFSGKIDHCMWVADEMCTKLKSRFNV
jgi:glycine/D-amino acid oxidase-like deaminating enzyme